LHAWHERVDAAQSVAEVVACLQDFVASLTPGDVYRLPESCFPGPIRDAGDIDYWNMRLADASKADWGTDHDGELLTEVAKIFLRASVRVSRLTEAAAHP
jgi:hypothetical protein